VTESADWSGIEVVTLEATDSAPDGKGVCPDCGKVLTITQAGKLRSHTCVNDVAQPRASRGATKGKGRIPASVRSLGVAGIAAGVEYASASAVVQRTKCPVETAEKVVDMGADADVMIGPFLDLLWPRIPKSAQKALTSLADEKLLIAAGFAWLTWGRNIKAFVDAETTRQSEGEFYGPVSGATHQGPGSGLGLVQPVAFVPDSPSAASL